MRLKNTYFVMRHGQSENNVAGLSNTHDGSLYRLTELGKEQSRAAAEKLRSEGIDLIYCSPYRRTRETADIVSEKLGVTLQEDARLVELREPIPDGDSRAGWKQFEWGQSRNGEGTYLELYARISDFIGGIETDYAGKTFLIITHATPLNMLEAVLATEDAESARKRFTSVQMSAHPFRANAEAFRAGGNDESRSAALKLRFGPNFAVFILFFGAAAFDAVQTGHVLRVVLFAALAFVFLYADGKRSSE